MTLATLGFICAQNIRSSFNESSPLSNENFSALISRPNITTPFEEYLNEYDERERAPSNDVAMRKKAIINSDNSNETALHITISKNKVASNDLEHCSLNNDSLIDNLRRNKTDFYSSKPDLVVVSWVQTLIF